MAIGRRVLDSYVLALCGGSGFDLNSVPGYTPSEEDSDHSESTTWEEQGRKAFTGDKGEDIRYEVVENVLQGGNNAGWCDEQVSVEKNKLIVDYRAQTPSLLPFDETRRLARSS